MAEQVLFRVDLETLEAQCQRWLPARLSAALRRLPQRVAIAFPLQPDDGYHAHDASELRRGEAKAGTTRFPAFATA